MKYLKYLLIGLGSIIVIVLIISAFMPSEYALQRSVQINLPDSTVFRFTADHNNRKLWDPWLEMEPSAVVKVTGTPGQSGYTWQWEGKTIGNGLMKTVALHPYSMIRSEIYFGGSEEPGIINWEFTPAENGTLVSWSIKGPLGYPLERLMGPLMDSMIGDSFEKGLSNLKSVLESR